MTTRQSIFLVVGVALALGWAPTVAADDQKFPATGQTTVYRPGDDGTIQAGATLRYKDNRNGTVTDRKKDDNNAGGIHDKDNTYTWDDAFDVHVFTLNNTCANDETVDCSANGNADCAAAGVGGKCGFAGRRDWRVPNVKELQSIVNYQVAFPGPVVSSEFNDCQANDTVLTGSCTAASGYWSSTTFANFPNVAWFVNFNFGSVDGANKNNTDHVRAVRGGSP